MSKSDIGTACIKIIGRYGMTGISFSQQHKTENDLTYEVYVAWQYEFLP